MKIFEILLALAFLAKFTPMEAHNQQKVLDIPNNAEKVYVSAEHMYFSNSGIFWQIDQDNWIPVNGVEYDSGGMYLTGSRVISSYRLVCKTCGRAYIKSFPSQCETCGNSDFDLEYEDLWDRQG